MDANAIKVAAIAVELLSIQTANYKGKTPRPDGCTHRAEKAELMLAQHYDCCIPDNDTPYTWWVKSASKPGIHHPVDLTDLSCQCEDWKGSGVCWHLIAAAIAEAGCTRCARCGAVMQEEPWFQPYRLGGPNSEKCYHAGLVCRCGAWTIPVTGETGYAEAERETA